MELVNILYKLYGQAIKSNYSLPNIPCLSGSPKDLIELIFHKNGNSFQNNFSQAEILYSIPQNKFPNLPSFEIKKVSGEKEIFQFTYGFENKRANFLYNASQNIVDIYRGKNVEISELFPILFGSFLGSVLRLKDKYVLHGTSITKDSKTITICGTAGAGKSTLAAYFLSKGFSLVCDDISVFTDSEYPEIYNSVPSIRLNNDTRDFCLPTYQKLFWYSYGNKVNKNYYEAQNFYDKEKVKLNAILNLNQFDNKLDSPQISKLNSAAKIMALIRESYANYILSPDHRKKELLNINKVLTLPIYSITQPKNFSSLKLIYSVIMDLI